MRLIKNNNLFRQRIFWGDMDFFGLTFTDIDACMNFFEKIIIFIEVKVFGKQLSYAQKKAFEAICNNLKIDSIFILANHKQKDYTQNISLKECTVNSYYYKKRWVQKDNINLADFLEKVTKYYYNKESKHVKDRKASNGQ